MAKFIPDISITNLKVRYQHHWLFENFSLSLPAGSWTCLLGASGVGKTTLLRLLAGLPTGTEIQPSKLVISTSDGQSLAGRITYMAQEDFLLPWLTVLENILLGYRLRGQTITANLREYAQSLLEQVGLPHAAHLRPVQLSGGMRQRVVLVRILLEDSPIVLMDEPFSSLDVMSRLRLQELAMQLLIGKTVVIVTHDPIEGLRLGDRVYVLSGSPVVLSEMIVPVGLRPRNVYDSNLLKQQAHLLTLLESPI